MKTWKQSIFIGMMAILVLAFALVACSGKKSDNRNDNSKSVNGGTGGGGGIEGTWKPVLELTNRDAAIIFSGNTVEVYEYRRGEIDSGFKGTYTLTGTNGSMTLNQFYNTSTETWDQVQSVERSFTLSNNQLSFLSIAYTKQ